MKKRKYLFSATAALLVLALLVSLGNGIIPAPVKAATSSELKEQLDALKDAKDELAQKIKDLEKQQAENFGDMESIIKQKAILDQQVALLYAEISNVNTQIAAYSLLIADKQNELDQAEARLAELNKKNKERIRAMEEEGSLSYWSVLFKANSFSDLLDRVNMIAEIAASDSRRLKEMREAAQVVADAKKLLSEEKVELERAKEEMEASQKVLDAKNAEADQLLADLVKISEDLDDLHNQFEKEEEDFLDEIAKKDNEYQDKLDEEASISASIQASIEASIQESKWLQASIEESIRQEQQGKPTTSTGGGSGTGDYGSPDNPSGVIWMVPCKYTRVSSPFGYRWHPKTGEWSMHKGVDLAAPKGTPIYASRSGYVNVATYHETAGNYITINHQDGYTSVYMHMTHYVVQRGEYVKAGQLVGYVGSTGRSTGPHLHFGIHKNGTYVNPMDYIG